MNSFAQTCFWLLLSVAWMAVIYALSDRPSGDFDDANDALSWLPLASFFAHLALYFVLGVFVLLAFRSVERLGTGMSVYLTLFVAFAYGVLDEIHQSNVEGRSSEAVDVITDVFGAALAVVFLYAVRNFLRSRTAKNRSNGRETDQRG